jgi:hypothetical protein
MKRDDPARRTLSILARSMIVLAVLLGGSIVKPELSNPLRVLITQGFLAGI